ncbi:SAYSvFN domain-containing protein 1 [Embiotoca jacksoni]|uniref:SAYSvFN domain-containing protein 1 n=1 Tax=Embiotoca jacksoni TaxID=100190 RepID=UPI0037043AF3
MEQKLASFRARRQAKNVVKERRAAGPQSGELTEEDTAAQSETTPGADSQPPPGEEEVVVEEQEVVVATGDEPAAAPPGSSRGDWLLDSSLGRWLASRQLVLSNLTLLKVLLWLVLLGLFVELEFGLPFFVISLFYWLYEGLRSPASRKPGELSAYSVFNPDCQPLLGSLTAEQLEGEMGYRPLANR